MKKYLILAATAGAMLAGCSKAEYVGTVSEPKVSPIAFSSNTARSTKAEGENAAATSLSNKFNVYGVKLIDDVYSDVFNNTLVKFDNDNNAWDYVKDGEELRYWDSNASKYSFVAFSDANETTITKGPELLKDLPDSGFTITNADTATLRKVYLAKAVEVVNDNFGKNDVTLTFINAAAKARMAFYESIPGYKVLIDSFYVSNDANATSKDSVVLFNDNGFLSKASYKFALDGTFSDTLTNTKQSNLTFGCVADTLREAITDAFFDNEGYTWVMPVLSAKDINLKLKYRLMSKNDTISRVSLATIPAEYAKWEPNHAYTYFFKITDNELEPITFTAQVEQFESNTQETITAVDAGHKANITTYVEGSNVQGDAEYKVGKNIFVYVTNCTSPTIKVTKANVDGVTEGNVVEKMKSIEENDSTFDTLTNGQSFTRSDAGSYVIKVTYETDKVAYKIVTVKSSEED